jgi:hypothetical protein
MFAPVAGRLCEQPLEARRAWLAQLPAAGYAPLFGESLTEATLCSLVDTASAHAAAAVDADLALQVLRGLSRVKRFDMLVMFLDAPALAKVKATFAALCAAGRAAAGDELARAWGLR